MHKAEGQSVEVADFLSLKNELNRVKAERDLLHDILLKIASPEDVINRQRVFGK